MAEMAPSDVRGGSYTNLAFVFTVPIGDTHCLYLDQDEVRRVDALLEPAIEIAFPMSLEGGLVAT